mgnify:CR=1 FL=1
MIFVCPGPNILIHYNRVGDPPYRFRIMLQGGIKVLGERATDKHHVIRDRFLASLEMTIEQGIKRGGKPGRFE